MQLHELIRRALKTSILHAAFYTGILSVVRRVIMKKHAVILMYHRLINTSSRLIDYSPNGMAVTPEQFDEQMQYVIKRYRVVPLVELVAILRRRDGNIPPNLCVVTFDDGWREVYEHAFPVLMKYGIPATVFLTINFIEGRSWFWEERLKFLVTHIAGSLRHHQTPSSSVEAARVVLRNYSLGDIETVRDSLLPRKLSQLVRNMQERGPEYQDILIKSLEAILLLPGIEERRHFLNWEEIREMAEHGIEFGNHSVSHINLATASEAELTRELGGADRMIQSKLGRRPEHVAYPYGKHDERIKRFAEQLGALSGCSTRLGLVSPQDDLYALKRINIHSDVAHCESAFAARLLNI